MRKLSEPGQTALRAAARELLADLDAVASEIQREIAERIGLETASATMIERLAASTTANVALVTELLLSGADPRTAPVPPQMTGFVVGFARAGRPAAELLRGYRAAEAAFWTQIQRRLHTRAADTDTLDEVSAAVSELLFEYAEAVLASYLEQHTIEVSRVAATTLRTEMVRQLLAGEEPDADLAGVRLRYDLDRWHTAFAIRLLESSDEPGPVLEAAAQHVGQALGGPPLLMSPGGDVIFGWIGSGRDAPSSDPVPVPGAIVAIGSHEWRLPGFRASHANAVRALEAAQMQRRPAGTVVHYRS